MNLWLESSESELQVRECSYPTCAVPSQRCSLRSKASTRKGPKPAAELSKLEKDDRKSRVDDKTKRCMSTRYATISSAITPADATPPSVPAIPLGYAALTLISYVRGMKFYSSTLRQKRTFVQWRTNS